MKKSLFILLFVYNGLVQAQQSPVLQGDYLGQAPPGDTPAVFAPGIVSTPQHQHSAPAFTPDGNKVYWSMTRGSNDSTYQHILFSEFTNGSWIAPQLAPFSSYLSYEGGPVISRDGKKLYLYRGLAAPPGGDARLINIICYSQVGNEWGNPTTIGEGVFHSVADNGTIYYTAGKQIVRRIYKNNNYLEADTLGKVINLPGTMNWTPFIAPDVSYLIFSRVIENGDYGVLYIAFHDPINDTFTEPVKLNDKINTWSQERFPSVSPDGKYLFFNRWMSDRNDDVFWVNARFINDLRVQKTGK